METLAPVPSNRSRYVTLDAMRGVAAIAVFLHHAHRVTGLPNPAFGALAVDLFFGLSGFVLAYAYDDRLDGMLSLPSFMRLRVIRLFPLFLLGFAICIPLAIRDVLEHRLALAAFIDSLLFNSVLLPMWPIKSWGAPFVLDGPTWSLFFELWVANLLYAAFWRRLHGPILAALITISGLALLATDIHRGRIDDVGFLWWGFRAGFARVIFSFFAGVAIARIHRIAKPTLQVPGWLMLAGLAALLSLPLPAWAVSTYEAICVFLLFPLAVYLGAAARERNSRLGSLLGDGSYAIYVVHSPLIAVFAIAQMRWGLRSNTVAGFVFAAAVIGLSCALHYVYDKPIREWLQRAYRLRKR